MKARIVALIAVVAVAASLWLLHDRVQQSVFRGQPDTAAAYAFVPTIRSSIGRCSATYLGSRTLVTARHCFDTRSGTAVGGTAMTTWLSVDRFESEVKLENKDLDLAALCMPRDPKEVLPIGVASPPRRLDQFTAVGFGSGALVLVGLTSPRASGTSAIVYIDNDGFVAVADPSVACDGDSGGPGLDSSNRAIGIAIRWVALRKCGQPIWYARTDAPAVATFIAAAKEACSI